MPASTPCAWPSPHDTAHDQPQLPPAPELAQQGLLLHHKGSRAADGLACARKGRGAGVRGRPVAGRLAPAPSASRSSPAETCLVLRARPPRLRLWRFGMAVSGACRATGRPAFSTTATRLPCRRVATSVATSRSSDASIASTRPDDLDAPARSGRIYASTDKVEGLVQANWVEVRVLFGASRKPCKTRGFRRFRAHSRLRWGRFS